MPETPSNPTATQRQGRRAGRYGRGEAMVWLMGGALIINVAMIAALVALIAVKGLDAFWPRPIDLVTLETGERFLGMPMREESFDAPIERRRELETQIAAGEVSSDALDDEGRPVRRLYRTGNRDLGQEPFRWVTLAELQMAERPVDAVFVERMEWGVFLGVPEALLIETDDPALPNTEGAEAAWTAIEAHLPRAIERRERIRALQRSKIGPINGHMTNIRERLAQARIEMTRKADSGGRGLPTLLWLGVIIVAGVLMVGPRLLARREKSPDHPDTAPWRRLVSKGALVLAIGLALFAWLERPRAAPMTPEAFAALQVEIDKEQADLDETYQEFTAQIAAIRDTDNQYRVLIRDPGLERFAPERQTTPDTPLRLSQIVRVFQPNTLTTREKLGIYFSRWIEFLTDDPREANTEGGVFPVIFGTVLLTILLSIVVVPLGVLAALYLREYAKQGVVTSILRIAVNNLAGVPSIVYGVFGLGFFCYTVGGYIDAGPSAATQLPLFRWWFLVAAGMAVVIIATAFGLFGLRKPGEPETQRNKVLRALATFAWITAFGLLAALLVTTPYFHGFFEARLPDPTFGKRGLLWASLTLALLTLPVVIVSTEEAISAVQPSLREGSYGCGASKWQTIRRIVLPGAAPGILTGMILAMARGAGEVAPLMLVGALKWAPELPVSIEAPFLHLDRSFMHLGFHIYDLGFQSPDSEAAQPLVWASTLLLLAVVLLLNLVAITLRARVRKKMGTGHF